MCAMYGNGGGGKADKSLKKENKQIIKQASKDIKLALKSAPKADKGISLKERAKGLAAAKGLAKLDVLQKPLKAAARKQLIKSQMKGK